jgi:type 1 fimbriae regulatory protein FimB/type 1 fimbriae regulatory protein FimE
MVKRASGGIVPHVADRDYLTPEEANRMIEAAGRTGRNGLRDQVLLRLIYRHGLRATEARHVKWSHLDLDTPRERTIHVFRVKGSNDSVQALDRDEVAGLRKLQQTSDSPFVFVSERGGVLSADMVARIVQRAAQHARIGLHVHPHMLRHAAGHMLANDGTDTRLIQDFLGHRDIRHTVRYTRLAPARLRAVRVR